MVRRFNLYNKTAMVKSKKKEIWVLGDIRNRNFFGYSLNVLSKAHELAEDISGKAIVVLLGSSSEEKSESNSYPHTTISIETAAKEYIAHGADMVYVIDREELASPRADLYSQVLVENIKTEAPVLFLFALTDLNREIAARSAIMCGCGLIADCVDIKLEGDNITATCPAWSGEIMCELTFTDSAAVGFATVQPHAFQAREITGNPGTIEWVKAGSDLTSKKIKLISCSTVPAEHRKLEEAEVVVVGGAGLGSAEQFRTLRNLAAALGGEAGATRPPVWDHLVDEERMIGQTGKTVKPNLLISIGTSGAIQYTAGIMESGTIVAVNLDKNAPIFQIADIGIVADAKNFLPVFTSKVKQAVMREIADVWSESDIRKDKKSGIGQKIRKLRESHGWTLESLSKKTGMSPDIIEQIENNETVPTVDFLLRLSRVLKIDPGTFLRDEEKAAIQDQRAQAFFKRTKNYYYKTLTPGAENEHLRAFMVTIEPKQAHKSVAYKHEGEEFVFVMEGSLELTLGNKPHILKEGESLNFNSDTPHKLKSLDNKETRCLVVLYTP